MKKFQYFTRYDVYFFTKNFFMVKITWDCQRKKQWQKNIDKTYPTKKSFVHSKFLDTITFKRIKKIQELPTCGKLFIEVVIYTAANTFFRLNFVCTAVSSTRFSSGPFLRKHGLNLFFRLAQIGMIQFLYHNFQFHLQIPPSLTLIVK